MYDSDHAPRFLSGAATAVLVLAAVAAFLAFCLYAWNLLIAEDRDATVPGVVTSVETRMEPDRKSTRLNSSHGTTSRMPSSA